MNQEFQMAKQIIETQRASVEALVNSLITMCEQMSLFFEEATWLPEEGKNVFRQLVEINRKSCEELMKITESSYSSLEKIIGGLFFCLGTLIEHHSSNHTQLPNRH